MSKCTGCGANNFDALRPNLACAPDLSQLLFRFIERNKLGIVKGTAELLSIDMSRFFMPLSGYSMSSITLCPDEVVKIESGATMDYGKRREIQQFDITGLPSHGITMEPGTKSNMIIELNGSMLGVINDIPMDDYDTFMDGIDNGIKNDPVIKDKLELGITTGPPLFTLCGKRSGDTFKFTIDVSNGVADERLIPEVTQTALRYPEGALKLILINITFCQSCVKPNNQYIEWAYSSDIEINGVDNATWRKTGPLFLQTGAEDITEDDMNMIESIYVRNTGLCDVELQTILSV